MWFKIAAAQDYELAQEGRDLAAKDKTPDQIAEAQHLAANGWRIISSDGCLSKLDFRLGSTTEVANHDPDVRSALNSVAILGAPVRWRKFVESDSVLRSLVKTNFVFVGG